MTASAPFDTVDLVAPEKQIGKVGTGSRRSLFAGFRRGNAVMPLRSREELFKQFF